VAFDDFGVVPMATVSHQKRYVRTPVTVATTRNLPLTIGSTTALSRKLLRNFLRPSVIRGSVSTRRSQVSRSPV